MVVGQTCDQGTCIQKRDDTETIHLLITPFRFLLIFTREYNPFRVSIPNGRDVLFVVSKGMKAGPHGCIAFRDRKHGTFREVSHDYTAILVVSNVRRYVGCS